LVEAFQHWLLALPPVACFDTVFHRDLPRGARLLPIPRRCERLCAVLDGMAIDTGMRFTPFAESSAPAGTMSTR
jgi:acetate kinase